MMCEALALPTVCAVSNIVVTVYKSRIASVLYWSLGSAAARPVGLPQATGLTQAGNLELPMSLLTEIYRALRVTAGVGKGLGHRRVLAPCQWIFQMTESVRVGPSG